MGLDIMDFKYLLDDSKLQPGLLLYSSGTLFFQLVTLKFNARGNEWLVAALVR